jgi:hypothetical protein
LSAAVGLEPSTVAYCGLAGQLVAGIYTPYWHTVLPPSAVVRLVKPSPLAYHLVLHPLTCTARGADVESWSVAAASYQLLLHAHTTPYCVDYIGWTPTKFWSSGVEISSVPRIVQRSRSRCCALNCHVSCYCVVTLSIVAIGTVRVRRDGAVGSGRTSIFS